MLLRLPIVVPHVLVALVTMLACVACDASASPDAKPKADKSDSAFELTPRHRLLYTGQVVETDKAKESKAPGVDFGVIPITPIGLKPYYNVFTKSVESRPVPGNPHKIPVLRAPHVQAFKDKPDPAKLALDQVVKFEKEAQLDGTQKFAVVSDGTPDGVRLISLSEITIPQDKDNQWRLKGTIEPLKLPEHIDDPIADRGRAVLTKEPLPLKGRVVFGTRKQSFGPAELHAMELPAGKPTKIGDATEPRISAGTGTVADRVDMRELRITDKSGKAIGGLKMENDEFAEFAIAPDGKAFAFSTERFVEVPDALPRREMVTIVCAVDGKKLIEFIDYDDPAFMPDGNVLLTARSAGDGLFVGNVKTGKVTPIKIQDAVDEDTAGPKWPRQPAVSPDGKWVAYVSGRGVFVVGIDGKGWTPVWTPETEQEPQSQPVFSPDSRFLACVITPLNVMTGPGQVVVFDWHKHVRQPLPNTQGADSEGPLVWQP